MRDFPLFIKSPAKSHKAIFRNGSTHVCHQRTVVMQVVNTVQLVCKNLAALKEVPQISTGVIAAGVTVTLFIYRPLVFPVATIFYNNSAL